MWWLKVPVPEHIEYPRIDPVPEGVHRPFWSVMIPTYNCANYLERTLRSVLEQDPGPDEMQIEVVDDHSTQDDPEPVVRDVGRGRVSFFRQPQNVGLSANFTTCIQRAKGYWVCILHGDDMVMPGFYTAYKSFIEEHPEVVMVFCRAIEIDKNDDWINIMHAAPHWTSSGIVENAAYELVKRNFVCASTAVIAREAYVKVGGFASCLSHCADWEMWMRIAASGPIGYIHHPYLLYRVHPDSDTSRLVISAENIREIVRAIEIGVRRLPPQLQMRARTAAYRNYSAYANGFRTTLHAKQQDTAALRHAFWAFRLHLSARNLLRVIKSVILMSRSKLYTACLKAAAKR
jgi:glycosyltransferase involved in cell wall biosynthesis